jgi:inositol oxygenase
VLRREDSSIDSTKPTAGQWFCMLSLRAADGSFLTATEDGAIEARPGNSRDGLWQTLLGESSGEVCLRSVHGKFLCVEESGHVRADRPLNSTWETFQVVPLHDKSGVALRNFHGGYLCVDPARHTVVSSCDPVPWDGGGDLMSLVCNKCGAQPLHSRIMRKCQTAAFVKRETAKFGGFERAALSVRDAIERVVELTGEKHADESWVLRYMLASAEAVRVEGHPDWLQLVVFMYVTTLEFHLALRSIRADHLLFSTFPGEHLDCCSCIGRTKKTPRCAASRRASG